MRKAIIKAAPVQFEITPNPARDHFYVSVSGPVANNAGLKLINNLGQVVMDTKLAGNKQGINISALAEGIYQVAVVNAGKTMVKKLVVKK